MRVITNCIPKASWNQGRPLKRLLDVFYSKNIFEKLVHLVGFIIRIITKYGHLNVKLVNSRFACSFNNDW